MIYCTIFLQDTKYYYFVKIDGIMTEACLVIFSLIALFIIIDYISVLVLINEDSSYLFRTQTFILKFRAQHV